MDTKQIKTINEYIAAQPKAVQPVLKKIQQTIKIALPNSTEVISYSIPCFKVNGKYVMYFSGWKAHVAVYPVPHGTAEYQEAIKPFQTGKGTLRFLLDKPVPYDLIAQTAKFLLAERGQ